MMQYHEFVPTSYAPSQCAAIASHYSCGLPASHDIHDPRWRESAQQEVDGLSAELAANHAKLSPPTLTLTTAALRRVILTVIDDGCTCDSGEKHPWEFYEDGNQEDGLDPYTEDMATENRMRFVDAVIEAIEKERR